MSELQDQLRSFEPKLNLKEGLGKALTKSLPKDILLVIFIHGFRGTDTTFVDFPARLQHVLSETIDNVVAECIVFPAYETKGELNEAVVRLADWLTTLTVQREAANGHGDGGGAGKAKIILCGHSMGGLLAADTLLAIANSRPDKEAPFWPRIIACIAFDTPYFGLHPSVFKNSATKVTEYADTARSVASGIFGGLAGLGTKKVTSAPANPPTGLLTNAPTTSGGSRGWGKWAAYGGAVLAAGAAAGTAYYKRDDLTSGYGWASDHMRYIGNLWDENAMRRRVESIINLEDEAGVLFRAFYTFLPPSPPVLLSPRTFIILPPKTSRPFSHFIPASNGMAPDELQAHTGMFTAKTNDGYYMLGLDTSKIIREAMNIGRGLVQDEETEATSDAAAEGAMADKIETDQPKTSKPSKDAREWMEKGIKNA